MSPYEYTIFKVTIERIYSEDKGYGENSITTLELIRRWTFDTDHDETIFVILQDLNLLYEFKDRDKAFKKFKKELIEAIDYLE